jgi:hypothetical protein
MRSGIWSDDCSPYYDELCEREDHEEHPENCSEECLDWEEMATDLADIRMRDVTIAEVRKWYGIDR